MDREQRRDAPMQFGAARKAAIVLLILASSAGLALPAPASLFTIDVTQQGNSLVATGRGSIDLTGLTFYDSGDLIGSFTEPRFGVFVVGPAQITGSDSYSGITAPGRLGPGAGSEASNGSGDLVGPDIAGSLPVLVVPEGYTSGDLLSDNATWNSTTLYTLGLTPGTYTDTWDSGADSLVIHLGINVVPEPASLPLLAFALLGFGSVRRKPGSIRSAFRKSEPMRRSESFKYSDSIAAVVAPNIAPMVARCGDHRASSRFASCHFPTT